MTDGAGSKFIEALDRIEDEENLSFAALQFEALVLALLGQAAAAQDRTIEAPPGRARQEWDAWAPEGLFDLPGPVAVEIKLWRSGAIAARALSRRVEQVADAGVGGLLLVINQHIPGAITEQWAKATAVPLHVIDRAGLARLAAEVGGQVEVSSHALFASTVRRVSSSSGEWRDNQSSALEELKALMAQRTISFVLGAGVSKGAGLPDWWEVIGGLFSAAFVDQLGDEVTVEQLARLAEVASALNSESPLQVARYVRRAFDESRADFGATLSEVLYGSHDPDLRSHLLEAVAALCVPAQNGSTVSSVITYNFDDLLEASLFHRNVRHQPIYHDHATATSRVLPVYHVHGFLPRDRTGYADLDDSLLAFSEEGYHSLYSDPYHWSNIVQLNAFRGGPCVFLGLSLNDPNLRRLLEIAARKDGRPQHYAFRKRLVARDVRNLRNLDASLRARFLDLHHALEETILAELGVRVIWFEDFDEMPAALDAIRAAT